jgi:poly-D-alanine transfer protein DltD
MNVEKIVDDLLAGTIKKEDAVKMLKKDKTELKHQYTSSALCGLLSRSTNKQSLESLIKDAAKMGDEMVELLTKQEAADTPVDPSVFFPTPSPAAAEILAASKVKK